MWFNAVLILLLAVFGLAFFYRNNIRSALGGTRTPLPDVIPPPVVVPPPPVEPPFDAVLTPARALMLGYAGVQDGRFYAYLNGLSLTNRKVWLAEFLRLGALDVKAGESMQLVNDVGISTAAWQVLNVLQGTAPGFGHVDFYGV